MIKNSKSIKVRELFGRHRKLYHSFFQDMEKSHLKAYAAEAAFFLVLSLVPAILLLLTLIKYTPVTEADVMVAVLEVFPSDINILVGYIVEEVYSKSTSVIPFTALVAVWSASRGVLSIGNGLNWIYGVEKERNYIYTRVRATLYTLIFVLAIVLSLVVLVFGNAIAVFIAQYVPVVEHVIHLIIEVRVLVSLGVLTAVFMMAYRWLPMGTYAGNNLRNQFPGALFTAVGWLGCSLAFSVYVDIFDGFTNMYGSLTTIVLIMLWLYFCMYFLLIGARINVYIEENFENRNQ